MTEGFKELKEPVSFRLMNNAAALEDVFKQKMLLTLSPHKVFQRPPATSVIYRDVGSTTL